MSTSYAPALSVLEGRFGQDKDKAFETESIRSELRSMQSSRKVIDMVGERTAAGAAMSTWWPSDVPFGKLSDHQRQVVRHELLRHEATLEGQYFQHSLVQFSSCTRFCRKTACWTGQTTSMPAKLS